MAQIDPAKAAKFIEAIDLGISVKRSAVIAGVSRSLVYEWRKEDEAFARQWESAIGEGLLASAREVRTTTDAVRLRAALSFLQSHDPERWQTRSKLNLGGQVALSGLAEALAKAGDAEV